jgi:hypothetical protein
MRIKTNTLILFSLLFTVSVAQAQVSITYSSMGKQHFTMAIADNWRINVGSEADLSRTSKDKKEQARLISAMPNDGVPLWFGMWVPDDLNKIEGAKEYMASLGLELLDDMVVTERKSETLNSLETYFINGTGKKEGESMDFRAMFSQISQERVAIAIYIGPPETTSSHGEELKTMINSIQPVVQ